MLDKLNHQQNQGPAEDIHSYLLAANKPQQILISIGATRYTTYGETNYLKKGDYSVVILYPETRYTHDDIVSLLESNESFPDDISVLKQHLI